MGFVFGQLAVLILCLRGLRCELLTVSATLQVLFESHVVTFCGVSLGSMGHQFIGWKRFEKLR
jgi:hypothetical protein